MLPSSFKRQFRVYIISHTSADIKPNSGGCQNYNFKFKAI
jgi:hypothetical protein